MESTLPTVIGNEAKRHFLNGFRKEGFTDTFLEKWASRKRKTARDRRRIDKLIKKGRAVTSGMTDQGATGRGLLVQSGAMRKALIVHNATWTLIQVGIIGISYAGYHNTGDDGFEPIRKIIGESNVLNEAIRKKVRIAADRFLRSF